MDYEKCKSGVIRSETLPECFSKQKVPSGLNVPVVAKIPVVLAEPVIQVDVESLIELEEPAIEIKRIKKNLFITQCKVISFECGKIGKVFLSGYVRKNIEYATASCCSLKSGGIGGNIKHTTVKVPFKCVAKVYFDTPPSHYYQKAPKESSLLFESKKGKDLYEEPVLGSNPCEQRFEHFENFNEEISCELVESKIYEVDIHEKSKYYDYDNYKPCDCNYNNDKDYINKDSCYNKDTFNKIVEKMVILVKLKLLQKQQVDIKDSYNTNRNRYK